MRNSMIAAATAALLLATPALAQTTSTTTPPAEAVTASDFVMRAAMGDRFEIESAKLVQSKSKAKSTDQFARHLVEDHGRSSKQLSSIAQQAGVKQPTSTELDAKHQAMLDELKQANRGDVDKVFARMQQQAHQEALQLYESYAANGDNPALKSFAQKSVPTLEKHLDMAKKLSSTD